MRLRAALLGVLLLASCVPAPEAMRALPTAALPEARRFAGPPAATPAPANPDLARDFMALTFRLENGRALPVLSRFEGPITVGVERVGGARPPRTFDADLGALLARLRAEAGLDIGPAGAGEAPSITVSLVPRDAVRGAAPDAACFVVPRVSGWRDYQRRRRSEAMDWTTLRERRRATVVLPADASAQEQRDCLHEELAQALGPLNDLYGLAGSVFNDDNLHVVLTDRDMLVLRATYDPALRSGMDAAAVAARLPAILDRLNPAGRRPGRAAAEVDDAAWAQAIRVALSPARPDRARLAAARRAAALSGGWGDGRTALSQLALGRAATGVDAGEAARAYGRAGALYRGGDRLGAAHAALQLAAFALSTGDAPGALRLADGAVPAAAGGQNAVLLAQLLLIRAEALDLLGRGAEGARVRREGLAWGRYAWTDQELGARAGRVAALVPGA